MAINDFFVWGNAGQKLTPEQVKQQRLQAMLMQRQGADFSPAGGWAEAIGRGLTGFTGGLQERRANEAEQAGIASANAAFSNSGIADYLAGGNNTLPAVGASGSAAYTAPVGEVTRAPATGLAAYLTPDKDESHLNFEGEFSNRLARFLADAPDGGISIYSGYRSPERQAQLWEDALKKYGSPEAARKWVAPPGKSNHNRGSAADLRYASDAQRKWAHENAARYGLNFRLGNEPWHIEPLKDWHDNQQGVQVASLDHNFTPEAAAAEVAFAQQNNPVVEALAAQPVAPVAASATSPVSEALLAQNDMALGGALAPSAGTIPAQQQRASPNMAAMLELANNPYLNDTQRSILNATIKQQMQNNDPLRALQMQQAQQGLLKGELEIEAMRQPKAPEYGFQTLGDGTVVRTNKATGEVVPAYEGTPKQTTDVQNYEYAKAGGYQGSFEDYQQQVKKAGASSTNVNVGGEGTPGIGKLSNDYAYVLDPETRQPVIGEGGLPIAAPVPGSPAARQIEESERADAAKKRNASDYAKTVVEDTGIARNYLTNLSGLSSADGIVGANYRKARSNIAGTPEYNMRQFIESALSNVTLDTMNRMRETSAAGATGMGNMSDRQTKIIQGVLGQWDPGLPLNDQLLIIDRLHDFYVDVQFGSEKEREEAVKDGRMTQEESDAIDQLYSSNVFGGDGGWQDVGGVKIRRKQ